MSAPTGPAIRAGGERHGEDDQPAASEYAARMVVYPYARLHDLPDPTPADGPDPYGTREPDWLEIDWRRRQGWIELDGDPVNYVEIGAGPPIVFVHGLGGAWQNWLENLPHFAARGYRAIALDLPGFGASPMPDWEATIPRYGQLLNAFCRELNVHACTLVGNSMGGFIAAEVAISRPDWVQRLALVSAAGISHAQMRRRPAEMITRMMTAAAPLALRFGDAPLRRPGLRGAAFAGVFRHPLRVRRELLYEFFVAGTEPPAFLDAAVNLIGYDILDRLTEIEVPTKIVWGREDRVVPSVDAAGYAERISDSRLEIFADCGHVPMAERPLRFNRTLERFIDE